MKITNKKNIFYASETNTFHISYVENKIKVAEENILGTMYLKQF
jgi:hypothetical protein